MSGKNRDHFCRSALTGTPITLFIQDRELRYTWIGNPPPGLFNSPPLGNRDRELLPAADVEALESIKRQVLQSGGSHRREITLHVGDRLRHYDLFVEPLLDQGGRITGVSGALYDITDYKLQQAALSHQASHDQLTRLPNRSLLLDRLTQAIAYARRRGRGVALLFFDLDRFKLVNDCLGHEAGDTLLQIVATRLTSCIRAEDTVARMGGDEFVVVMGDLPRRDLAATMARKMLKSLRAPLNLGDQEFHIDSSVGISLFPQDGDSAPTLIKHADTALARAKRRSRGTVQFYSSTLERQSARRVSLRDELRHALERDQLELLYQPRVGLQTGRITGAEAWLRWRHPDLGVTLPDEFLPIAEESGLSIAIGEWMLGSICAQARDWGLRGIQPPPISVNLFTRQFIQRTLPKRLARILGDAGLEPSGLELEITERQLVQDTTGAETTLKACKSLGVGITIDDFGTGYSSLNYLKRFPIDRLKIHYSFIHDVASNPDNASIALAVIALGHSLRLQVVAAGVETQAQLDFLRSRHCDEVQGTQLSRPLTAAELAALLERSGGLLLPMEEAALAQATVLLVDDNPDVTGALALILGLHGYRVLTAQNAQQGLRQLTQHRVGVVIADQVMPGMNGTEFLGQVRDAHPDTMRILMTGHGDRETLVEAINQGAIFRFLEKPTSGDTVLEAVRDALRQRPGG